MEVNLRRAIILLSGGMDSLVTAAIAKKENDEVYFLHVNYGQRTEAKELDCFNKLCDYFQPKDYKIIDISYLKDFGGSSLLDTSISLPSRSLRSEGGEGGGASLSRIPNTYVPYRNGNLISIAASWAEVIQAQRIYIGAVEVDGSGYPDCREVFFRAIQKAINFGTRDETRIKIYTPLIKLKKSEIVKLGNELNAPFELSWSCYQESEVACGVCDSCYLRLRAFQEAGVVDPIIYRERIMK